MNGSLRTMRKSAQFVRRRRLTLASLGLAVFLLALLAHATIAEATVWYFRNSVEESYPANAPTAHQTGEAIPNGAWQGRAMTLVNGTTSESHTQSITATGYWKDTTFSTSGISPAQTFVGGESWSVRIWASRSGTQITVYPRIYIYEWHPLTGKGAVFLTPTQGGTSVPSTATALTVSGPGAAGTLEASTYLCVDVYWNVTARTQTKNLISYWGNSTYDSYLTSQSTEVPTLGFWLLSLVVAFFLLIAIRKQIIRVKPAAVGVLLVIALAIAVSSLPRGHLAVLRSSKPAVDVTVTDRSGKEVWHSSMRPVENLNEVGLTR